MLTEVAARSSLKLTNHLAGTERAWDAGSHVLGDSFGDDVVELAVVLDYGWQCFPSLSEKW